MQVAIAKRPLEGTHCGDQAACWEGGGRTVLCIVDGLGHGEGAERAAMAALRFVERHRHEPLAEIFAGCDEALADTRGVAMGIAVVDPEAETLAYAGIGNTRALVVGRETVRLSSWYGIVGGRYRKLRPETVPLPAGSLVILSTDGIEERLDLSSYNGTRTADVGRLTEMILRDWRREGDDAAVLVFRSEGK